MSSAKLKETKEPTLANAVILGVLSAFIGALFGFVFLTTFKAQAFTTIEDRTTAFEEQTGKTSMPSDAYFMEGPRAGSAGWELQRQRLLSDSEEQIDLSVGELNAWMASSFRPSKKPKKEDQSNFMVFPGTPNFFAEEDGILSVNLPTELLIFGKSYKYMISARGYFAGGSPNNCVFDRLQVNSAPIPSQDLLVDQLIKTLLAAFSATEEYQAIAEAWWNVESVEVVGGLIRIQRG
ncbi:MAG: hypothetical protein AAGH40_09310 [Verrucomicrobiota bacterium]